MINCAYITIGFALLFAGAHFLINGASSLSRKLHISSLVIGLTIVAFGTSMPELFVNLVSNYDGQAEIAIGNILGANIADIFLILGLSSLIYPLKFKKSTAKIEIPMMISISFILWLLLNLNRDGNGSYLLSGLSGLILLILFLGFLYYTFTSLGGSKENDTCNVSEYSWHKSILLIALGFLGLLIGGKLTVVNAVAIANRLNVSQAVISLTIISIGTTLPELITSTVAAYEKKFDIAVGNVIGSVIFNTSAILGISAAAHAMSFRQNFAIPFIILISGGVILYLNLIFSKRLTLGRWHGLVLIVIYLAYLVGESYLKF